VTVLGHDDVRTTGTKPDTTAHQLVLAGFRVSKGTFVPCRLGNRSCSIASMYPHSAEAPRHRRWQRLAAQVGLALSATLAVLIGLIAWEIHVLTTPTQPEHVRPSSGERRALLVVDVQEDYTGATARGRFPYPNSAEFIERLNALAERGEAAGLDVIYIRQVLRRPLSRLVSHLVLGSTALAGEPGAEFDRRLRLVSNDRFQKPFSDAFSSREFEAFVRARGIGELFLAGLDGAGCIDVTARGARQRGLSVTVLEDAVTSQSSERFQERKAEYPKLGIRVLSSAQLDFVASRQP
jgi:nicotinamidase-related amidase